MAISNATFWHLIALVGGFPPADEKSAFVPLEDALAEFNPADMIQFAEILAERLYAIDRQSLAAMPSIPSGRGQSPDTFLYNRCAVIIAGEAAYRAVLDNDEAFRRFADSRVPSCERVLYAAAEAYERVTGKPWEHQTAVSYETASNPAGWPQ